MRRGRQPGMLVSKHEGDGTLTSADERGFFGCGTGPQGREGEGGIH